MTASSSYSDPARGLARPPVRCARALAHRRRPRSLGLVRTLLAGACALAAATGARAQTRADTLPGGHVEGEYGLWVENPGDSMVVYWRTAEPTADALVVRRGFRTERFPTPAAPTHRVVFLARGSLPLSLQYDGDTTTVWPGPPAPPPLRAQRVDSIFVVGDVHGEFDNLVGVLRHAGVVDGALRWVAGRAHLVMVGDLVDRGADATRVLWLLYRLDHEAAAAGGRVDIVLGNHELMIFQDDYRYTSPKELSLAADYGVSYARLFDVRRSVLGRWLASKPPVVTVNGVLFAHGGITPDYLAWSLEALRDTLSARLRSTAEAGTDGIQPDGPARAGADEFVNGGRSIFWYRDYVRSDSLAQPLRLVLDHFRARALVVGHTPLRSIALRYGGHLVAVNTVPFAAELLLITRKGNALEGWRYRASGPPERLGPIGATPTSFR